MGRGWAVLCSVSCPSLAPACEPQAHRSATSSCWCGPAEVILNARVQMDAPALRALVAMALAEASLAAGVTYRETAVSFFHPSFPHPTFRF